MGMVYVTMGKNQTGQVMVGCRDIPWNMEVNYLEVAGRPQFQLSGLVGHVWMLPSKKTILVVCNACYMRLNPALHDALQMEGDSCSRTLPDASCID